MEAKHIFGKPEPPLDKEIRECLEKAAQAYLTRFKEGKIKALAALKA